MPALTLNHLLRLSDIDPAKVIVLRNTEPGMREALPYIAAERPDLFRAYQEVQGPKLEAALRRASHMASFVGHGPESALFVALYAVGSGLPIDFAGFWSSPEHQELLSLGYAGYGEGATGTRFPLSEIAELERWAGKLVVRWPGPAVSWWRWANRNEFLIEALLPEGALEKPIPDWNKIVLTWAQLAMLPRRWQPILGQWRGIYYVFDVQRKLGYVGSAYGTENLLGRWRAYGSSGHGGNKGLRGSQPADLRFSILQLTSPNMDPDDIIRLEATWKERLHTREHGLNEN